MGGILRITRQRITQPGQLGLGYTADDGLGLWRPHEYLVEECIIDLSALPLSMLDEAAAVTWGASAVFRHCIIRGAGKLVLIGSGDADKAAVESGQRVQFEECVFEDFGRRGVEVQGGMRVVLQNCLVRNWGHPSRHTVRDFAGWAHTGGRIDALGCVWWQDGFARPWAQLWEDWTTHIAQAWLDEGWSGLLRPGTYLPGVCRGLTATAGGEAYAWRCWRNRWWIVLPWRHTTAMMPDSEALALVERLEAMAMRLEVELPRVT